MGANHTRTILIVDDNRDQTDMLVRLFEMEENAVVHFAYDGEKAVELAKAIHPDVIIMDLAMPKLSGYDAARAIRDIDRRVKIIALSGEDRRKHHRRTTDAGFDAYISKPAEFETLRDLINTLVPE